MKSTSKMMVIAAVFLVAAALLVAPGAARNLTNGDTFFAEENGAELTLDFPEEVGTISRLVKIEDNDFEKKSEVNDFRVNEADDTITTNLQGADFKDSYFGTYFVENESGLLKDYKLYFEKPTLKVDVVLANDKSSSVAGKTVTKDNQVFFKVDTGKVGSTHNANVPANYFNLKVELKGEKDGSTITVIPHDGYNQDLKGVDVTQQLLYVGNSTNYDGTPADGIYLKDLTAQTYAVKAVWTGPDGFNDYAADSAEATFTVSTVDLSIEANKENVVRNNDFSVTVTGNSKSPYFLYIKDASVADKLYPQIKVGQPGVTILGDNDKFENLNVEDATESAEKLADRERATNGTHYPAGTAALVDTNAGGQRTIGFNTFTYTDDKSFTIKVVNPEDSSKYDDVKVKIEEGEVTITAEGSGTYYLGEEIKLSGTNTDNDQVYLFMTGPNLGDENGVSLVDIDASATRGEYLVREVEGDDTWEYRWDTSAIEGGTLDADTYNIYAVSREVADNGDPVTKNNLKGVKYATFNVRLDQPFLTLDDVASTVAKGDDLTVSGVAEGNPDNVRVWVFGKNYRNLGESESVEDDGTFEFDFENTESLATGQYFLVVQHPMTDREFNVRPAPEEGKYVIRDATGSFIDLGKLSASEAANALVDALNSPYCDDTYRKVSFNVAAAVISIEPVGDQSIGTKFTISGTTNLAVGDDLQVSVSGASFGPATKSESTGSASSSGTVTVEKGDGINTWSYEVDASDFKPDQYTVTVESIDADASASSTFNMIDGPVSPVETETTPIVTTETPEEPTTAPSEPTPTTTPGFGALVALVGLGAVAFLVMRRD